MPIHIKLPDGSIGQFPDGMSDDAISAVLQKQFGPPQQSAGASMPDATKPPGMWSGAEETLLQGAGHLSDIGAGVKQMFTHPLNSAGLLIDQANKAFDKPAYDSLVNSTSPTIQALKGHHYANAGGQVLGGLAGGVLLGRFGGGAHPSAEIPPQAQPRTLSGFQGRLQGEGAYDNLKTGETFLPEGSQRIDYSGHQAAALANRNDNAAAGRMQSMLEAQLNAGRNASANPRVAVGPPEMPNRDTVSVSRAYQVGSSHAGGDEYVPGTLQGKPLVRDNSSSTAQVSMPEAPVISGTKAPGEVVEPEAPKKSSDGRTMGDFRNFDDPDARAHAYVAVENLKKNYELPPDFLKDLEAKTGVTTAGKSREQLIHDVNNWRNVVAVNDARRQLETNAPPPKAKPLPISDQAKAAWEVTVRSKAPINGGGGDPVVRNAQGTNVTSQSTAPKSEQPVSSPTSPRTTQAPPAVSALDQLEKYQKLITLSKTGAIKVFNDIPKETHEQNFAQIENAARQATKASNDPGVTAMRIDKALRTYNAELKRGRSETALLTALNVAKASGEGGFALGVRVRYSDSELAAQANMHVPRMLDIYEKMDDQTLANGRIGEKLEDPIFLKQLGMAAKANPALPKRWEAINRKAWAAQPGGIQDPLGALSRGMGKGVTITASDIAGDTLNEMTGNLHRGQRQLLNKLQGEITRHDSYSIEDSNRFYQQMEEGDYASMNEADQKLAPILRQITDSRWEKVAAMKDIDQENWIKNYMPHLWANVGRAREATSTMFLPQARSR
jgi:hypothetical protein